MQHIAKCTYVYVVHVFEVDYICRPQIPQLEASWISFHNANTASMLIAWQMKFDAPAENKWTTQTYYFRVCLHGGGGPQVGEVTRLAAVEK